MQYFEARYYDNGIGRFNSIDRVFWEVGYSERGIDFLFDPQLQNSYAFSKNNPLVYTDHNGENPILRTVGKGLGSGVKFIFKQAVKQVVKQTVKKTKKVITKSIQESLKKGSSKIVNRSSIKMPGKVINILNKIRNNGGKAPDGYVGGRIFKNKEGVLPKNTTYKEYDVNPYIKGQNRGSERLVIDAKGNSYFTKDHYKTFIKIITKK
ncbi:MAG: hypothetical protein GY828_06050 [Candidatus Gracilibacteria bacterium]|nr:hypothetical protein [Candidatus Gracilibacteria bacterium]